MCARHSSPKFAVQLAPFYKIVDLAILRLNKSWQKLHGCLSVWLKYVGLFAASVGPLAFQEDLLPFASDLSRIHVNVSLCTSLLKVSRQRVPNQPDRSNKQTPFCSFAVCTALD